MKYLISLVLFVLVGCATPVVTFTPTSTNTLPTFYGDVAVLDRLPENYQEVGWISCDAPAHTPPGELLVMAKEKARDVGASAIVYGSESFRLTQSQAVIFCRAINQER